VLGWLLGGTAAADRNAMNDDQLIAAVLESLPDFFGDMSGHFLEARVHRWIGAVNALPGGMVPQSLDRRHQPEPTAFPNLLMVGDYLFDSTLNGVLDSARYVAEWIAADIADDTSFRQRP
jgi:hypothetical protein